MQKATSNIQHKTERKRSPARTKRMMLILAAVALLGIAAGLFLIFDKTSAGTAAPSGSE